jgi:hypothetical protein
VGGGRREVRFRKYVRKIGKIMLLFQRNSETESDYGSEGSIFKMPASPPGTYTHRYTSPVHLPRILYYGIPSKHLLNEAFSNIIHKRVYLAKRSTAKSKCKLQKRPLKVLSSKF